MLPSPRSFWHRDRDVLIHYANEWYRLQTKLKIGFVFYFRVGWIRDSLDPAVSFGNIRIIHGNNWQFVPAVSISCNPQLCKSPFSGWSVIMSLHVYRFWGYSEMAKSRNHTAHNQSYKNHRNGIKKPKFQLKPSRKGVCSFFSCLMNSPFVVSSLV